MDHSLFVMGRIKENMGGGREMLNILLRKSQEGGSCTSKVYNLQNCVNLTFVVEKGWDGVRVLATSTEIIRPLCPCVPCDYLTDCYDNAEGDNASNYVLLSLLPSF